METLPEDNTINFEQSINKPVCEIGVTFDEKAVESLHSSLNQNGIFVLGEMHGVLENPAIIYTLFKKFGFKVLALEWDKSLRPMIDQFLEVGELNFNIIAEQTDGRVTAGHFALIKQLKEEGLLEGVVLFDDETQWEMRDEVMANNIIKAYTLDQPILIVAGNAHIRREDIEEHDGTIHPSMLHLVEKQVQTISVGKIEYLSCSFYNNKVKHFEKTGVEGKNARFYVNELGEYIFELPEAHPAVVPNQVEQDEE